MPRTAPINPQAVALREPGEGVDRFRIKVGGKNGFSVLPLTLAETSSRELRIAGGNISIPHRVHAEVDTIPPRQRSEAPACSGASRLRQLARARFESECARAEITTYAESSEGRSARIEGRPRHSQVPAICAGMYSVLIRDPSAAHGLSRPKPLRIRLLLDDLRLDEVDLYLKSQRVQ